ncbi:hypothetical protein GCM10007198_19250 [Microbacterium aerolatum]|uniref:Uncharacterized protein n=1 Tax=Microbacterium aerolatum TaxID=153731 RepID=A0A511AAH0_9MICO|nr:hypothetical protein MAE01_03560 [Microbacterium aerolatum]GGB28891.1 hypothetical protein GCM10007198_19250 [Microbacterium aerolatum]
MPPCSPLASTRAYAGFLETLINRPVPSQFSNGSLEKFSTSASTNKTANLSTSGFG